VFQGSFAVDAAEAVAGDDALDGVAALIDSSLLRRETTVDDEPRLGMLETIAAYARERLEERVDADAVRYRHARYYADLAVESEAGLRGPRQVGWLARIDAERENYRSALEHLEQANRTEEALRLAAGLWRYWQVRGGYGTAQLTIERLLALDVEVPEQVLARALASAGRLAFMYGDLDTSETRTNAALELSRQLEDTAEMCFALTVLGLVAQARGDSLSAVAFVDEAIAVARATGDWWSLSLALASRGEVLYAEGDLNGARHLLEEAGRAAREVGDLRQMARIDGALGTVFLELGEADRAIPLFEAALALQNELGDRWGIARTLTSSGLAARGAGDVAAARRHHEHALLVQVEADDRVGVAASLECLAELAVVGGESLRAVTIYAAAAVLRDMGGDTPLSVAFRDRDAYIKSLTVILDPDAFSDAWSRGRAMTTAEVVQFVRYPDQLAKRRIADVVAGAR
jgi:tetratricopeptide (TPR) repeat protein